MMTTAAVPPVLTDIANTATAPQPLKPDKRDSDENASSDISSSMPDGVPISSPSICAEDSTYRRASEPAASTKQLLSATPARLMNIDLNYESPLSRLELTPFLYGHGTELHPITEQRSITTLRNGIVSTPDLETGLRKTWKTSNNKKDKNTLENAKDDGIAQGSPLSRARLRRQQSFSLDSGKSHLLQTQQQYQQALHRKEVTSANGDSSSSSAAAGSMIDITRVLAEINSYPHHPPFSPQTQVITPPEYHEWLLSHPDALFDPAHNLQRRGQYPTSSHNSHGGNLANHPFVRRTTCFAPPTITATPPDTDTRRQQTPTTTAVGLRQRLGRWKSTPAAGRNGNDTDHNNNNSTRSRSQHENDHPSPSTSSSVTCARCDQPATEPWKL
ncbi:hypothetical protein PG994_001140 [Apiospora phragmitis]|uniref:Uncharacterized protein n=1 Tax=Apiospora phragmitis TaxID=2905665 RepID=A0ABR1WSP8_9PEZI